MIAVAFVFLVITLIIYLFFGTEFGEILKTRASGTVTEAISKDASTPEGAKAYYNAAIDKKQEEYQNAHQLLDQMQGKIQNYEAQMRTLQKQNMECSLKIKKYVDESNDDAAMTYIKEQEDVSEKIDTIKTALKELEDNATRQKEVVDVLREAVENLKREKDNAVLTLETAQTTKSLRATSLSDQTEDKMLEKVRSGVQKTKEEADGIKFSYDSSTEVQKKRLDKKEKDERVRAKLEEMKKNRK